MNYKHENNREANVLCVISLICAIGPILLFFMAGMFNIDLSHLGSEVASSIENFTVVTEVAMFIVGIVLMIFVRVKYPGNVFGKVLMWTYIVFTIIGLVIFVASIIFLYVMCNMSMEILDSCNM